MTKCDIVRVLVDGERLPRCINLEATKIVTITVNNIGIEVPTCNQCGKRLLEIPALNATERSIPWDFYYGGVHIVNTTIGRFDHGQQL